MDLAQILQRLCPPTNAQLQTRTPPTQLPGGQGPPKRLFPFSLRGYVPWGVGRSQTGGVCPPPSRPSHAHLPDEAVGGGVRRGAAIRALEAALALAVLALQRGVTGLGGALWASPPQHPQQHRFRTEHRELLRSAPPAATTQHPQTPTHQSGGGAGCSGGEGGLGPQQQQHPPYHHPHATPSLSHAPAPRTHTCESSLSKNEPPHCTHGVPHGG